jgi:hypothetical protein
MIGGTVTETIIVPATIDGDSESATFTVRDPEEDQVIDVMDAHEVLTAAQIPQEHSNDV